MEQDQRLELIKITGFKKSGQKYYKIGLFQCICGNEKEAYLHNVLANRTRSCGCKTEEHSKELHTYKKVYGRYKSN